MTIFMHNDSRLPSGLPALDPNSAEHGQRVKQYISDYIRNSAYGSISFEEWMNLALYAPGLGYYVAGSHKLGSLEQAPETNQSHAMAPTGDFTTAPELTSLFGYTVANQVAQVLQACSQTNVLEFGAGSGALAHSVLTSLDKLNIDAHYFILEVSPDLQERQKQRLEKFAHKVTWLNELPNNFIGCVLANEVLDAMPVKLFKWGGSEKSDLLEMHVALTDHEIGGKFNGEQTDFTWLTKPAEENLKNIMTQRMPPLPGYTSEINLRAEAWVKQMGGWLKEGAALLFDYGFPQAEYYHPQRAEGTLMCHFRHYAHAQPLVLAGLQDITAHVDFTAMADAALDGGLNVLGYTSQANFLINSGLPEIIQNGNEQNNLNAMSAVQKLLSEAEMGELFKVMAIGTDLDVNYPLIGFSNGDRRDRL